jgi:hypothetical protein
MNEKTSATFIEHDIDSTAHPEYNGPSKWGVKRVSCIARVQNLQNSRGNSDDQFGNSRSREECNNVKVVLLELRNPKLKKGQ